MQINNILSFLLNRLVEVQKLDNSLIGKSMERQVLSTQS